MLGTQKNCTLKHPWQPEISETCERNPEIGQGLTCTGWRLSDCQAATADCQQFGRQSNERRKWCLNDQIFATIAQSALFGCMRANLTGGLV